MSEQRSEYTSRIPSRRSEETVTNRLTSADRVLTDTLGPDGKVRRRIARDVLLDAARSVGRKPHA